MGKGFATKTQSTNKTKKIITSKNMKWTIFFDQQLKLNEPTFGRTLNVHEINNASDVASLLSR